MIVYNIVFILWRRLLTKFPCKKIEFHSLEQNSPVKTKETLYTNLLQNVQKVKNGKVIDILYNFTNYSLVWFNKES